MINQTFLRNNNPITLSFLIKNVQINFQGLYWGISHNHHYVSGSFIDPLTNILSVIGVFYLLLRKKINLFFFLLVSYSLIFIISGVLFYENTAAITRLFFILPFVFILAALGVNYLSGLFPSHPSKIIFISSIVFLVLFLNLKRFYIQTPSVHPKTQEVIILENIYKKKDYSLLNYLDGNQRYIINEILKIYEFK